MGDPMFPMLSYVDVRYAHMIPSRNRLALLAGFDLPLKGEVWRRRFRRLPLRGGELAPDLIRGRSASADRVGGRRSL